MMSQATYDKLRDKMCPGDVILFGGKGWLSRMIRWGTRSPVSHAGIITRIGDRVMVSDSTQMGDRIGVFTRPMSDVLEAYPGRVWWLPLSGPARARMNHTEFNKYLDQTKEAEYDIWQCCRAGFRALTGFNIGGVKEDASKVFCSEFVAIALKRAGVYRFINASVITPGELPKYPIYAEDYAQLKGKPCWLDNFTPEYARSVT